MMSNIVEPGKLNFYKYNHKKLQLIFSEIIAQNVSAETLTWLKDKAEQSGNIHQFNTAFASVPRRTGKSLINVSDEQYRSLQEARKNLYIKDWTIDRLCRVWLLLEIDAREKENYFNRIEKLFLAAEMSELVALYSSLPVLAYPDTWVKRCAEGIRSNIGDVLTSIICKNPYPAEFLEEGAWNQMVLKAFFTEKPVNEIIGLDERANQKLADTLCDYAHERWAASRSVNPQLWRVVSPFLNDLVFRDIIRLANSENPIEKEAAALVCRNSEYLPARQLLRENKQLLLLSESASLTWDTIGQGKYQLF